MIISIIDVSGAIKGWSARSTFIYPGIRLEWIGDSNGVVKTDNPRRLFRNLQFPLDRSRYPPPPPPRHRIG